MAQKPAKSQPHHAAAFEAVVAVFAHDRDVAGQRKFAIINLTASGKVFAFTNAAGLVVKLPAPRVAELIAAGAATPLVMGKRTMREWAVVLPGKAPWPAIATEARAFVAP